MGTDEPFLRRVRAYPDDDGPRLILADWLDEQGGPAADRAVFIRVQLALAGLPADDPHRPDLLAAERALLDRYGDVWSAPFRGLATGLEFRRGFVDEVRVPARVFVREAARLFAAGPIRHLHLLDLGGSLPAAFASPYLGRLAALTVYAQHAGEGLGRAVGRCPHLGGLRALYLNRNRLRDAGAAALVTSPGLSRLETLALGENDLSGDAARALADTPHGPNLRELELADNPLGPAGAEALATSARLAGVRRLGLARAGLGGAGPAGPGLGGLLRVPALDLSGNGLGPADLKGLFAGPPARVRELDLSHNDLGETGVRVLADGPALGGLVMLRLVGCNVTDEAAGVLAGSPHLDRLAELDLGNNPVGDVGFRAFLAAPGLRGLRRLVVPGVGVSPQTRAALARRFPGVVRF
ncbi:MAG: TIGR02996 domain-containing protein [Gemmataceae bacterium]|nr:TIGR02996 domain-containing protein [Gemmataceae bacterium]